MPLDKPDYIKVCPSCGGMVFAYHGLQLIPWHYAKRMSGHFPVEMVDGAGFHLWDCVECGTTLSDRMNASGTDLASSSAQSSSGGSSEEEA